MGPARSCRSPRESPKLRRPRRTPCSRGAMRKHSVDRPVWPSRAVKLAVRKVAIVLHAFEKRQHPANDHSSLPGAAHSSKSAGVARTKTPSVHRARSTHHPSARDRDRPRSVNEALNDQLAACPSAAPAIVEASVSSRDAIVESARSLPASSNNTERSGFSLSLAASAHPAEPAPTMTTSKWFTPNRSYDSKRIAG